MGFTGTFEVDHDIGERFWAYFSSEGHGTDAFY